MLDIMAAVRQSVSRKGVARRAPKRDTGAGAELPLAGVAKQVRAWTDSVLGVAGAAADISIGAAKAMLVKPEQRAALEKTGAVLRGMREAAGMSVSEVGRAIDLKDPALLELVESGKIALPFEIILRLASVLGRNDPISFVMRFTRSYNPDVWHTLEDLGIGRFAVLQSNELVGSIPSHIRYTSAARVGLRRSALASFSAKFAW